MSTYFDRESAAFNQYLTQRVSAGRASQRGMSVTSLLILVVVAMFLGLFAFKVIPPRLEYITVKTIGQDIANNEELMKQPKSKVVLALQKSFRANSLWELQAEDTYKIVKDGRSGYKITVDYERRSNLFSNIDVVSRFNHTYNEDI